MQDETQNIQDYYTNLKALIDNTSDLIWSIDRNYCLTASNSLFIEKIQNYTLQKPKIGESFFFKNFPESLRRNWEINYRLAFRGESVVYEGKDITSESRYRDYSLFPIRDKNGEVIGVNVQGRDITKRKQTEEFLKYLNQELDDLNCELEERVKRGTNEFRNMVNALPVGLIVFKKSGIRDFIITEANQTARSLFQLDAKDLDSINLLSKYEPSIKLLQTLKETIPRVAETGKTDIRIIEISHQGEMQFARLHAFLIEPYKIGIMIEDITETQQWEMDRETYRVLEMEHRRIGQDLHDGLGGHLTGILFLLQALKGQAHEPDKIMNGLDKSSELIRKAINYTKGLVRGLIPEYLSQKGFFDSVKCLIEDLESIYGISCHLHIDKKLQYLESKKYNQIFYIIREALNNAIKHGNTSEVEISFRWYPEHSKILIINNGESFPEVIPDGGMGLQIMKHRASLMDANLKIYPRPECGGSVCQIELPHQSKKN